LSTELLARHDLNRRNELARTFPSFTSAIFIKLERKGVTTASQLRAARDCDLLHDVASEQIDATQLARLRAAVAEHDAGGAA
jgi:hypothetical protein